MARTDPAVAAPLVADLGFLLARDLPGEGADALLVVALREIPTLRHFDPELVTYWRTDELGRGRQRDLTLESPFPIDVAVSWGPIEIVDRLNESNTFFTVGGRLRAARLEDGSAVATFASPGPILSRGGHSQAYDRLAAELTAFFARVLVPIDFVPGAESLVSRATPLTRYAAFLRFDVERIVGSELVRESYGPDARVVRAEAARLRRRHPEDWEAGGRLLAELGLVRAASPAGSASATA
jgi:hypothetical protein